ncbi:hypothetical protein SADUNF_Sadunf07G0006000 [Salix dunnii]|uniref:Retrotransposon Copia-like N-terminal domain-containing protein n=1 Tax=Salix dunnii TaxID=1413687 RepID=A0A835K0V6_9ROSI|nr:hypothetical protein SADUNF_Sadunf07G0006000 [Salix dunnii]
METENLQTLQQTPPSAVQSTSRFHNLSDQNNPYRLDNSDTSVLSLVTDPLTTENYVTWARAMRRVLRAKNKLGFVDGSITKPSDPNDPLREAWERCNDMIVSWIHNSVSSSVKSSFVLVDNACEIWNELCERLTQQNGPRIFQLKGALANLTQGNDLVNVYHGKLKSIWDELSLHCPMPECSCGQMKILIDRYQQDCVIQFLMGLNETYSNVRDQIMLMDPIPQVSKVFSLVQQQEKQHQMLLSTSAPDSMQTLALSSILFLLQTLALSSICHISNSRLKLIKDPIVIKNSCFVDNATPCSVCPMARQHKLSFDQSYKLLDLETNDTFLSRNVTFHENIFPFDTPTAPPDPASPIVQQQHNLCTLDPLNIIHTSFDPATDNCCLPSNSDDLSSSVVPLPETSDTSISPLHLQSSPSLTEHSPISTSSSPHIPVRKSARVKQAPKYLQDFHCQQVSLNSLNPIQLTTVEVSPEHQS